MNYFFGRVDPETLDVMSSEDLDTLFYNENGEAFWYFLDLYEEDIMILDTTGREMPVDREQIDELAAALLATSAVYEAMDEAQNKFDETVDEINAELALGGYPILS